MRRRRHRVRMPASPPAQVRATLRRLDVTEGARAWDVSARDALLIAAGLPASPRAVARVLQLIADRAAEAASAPPRGKRGR